MAGQGPKRQLSNTGSGLRLVTKNTAGVVSPFLLEEPQWSADKDIPTCNVCGEKFSFLVRRHHCRRCGQIFCGKHCDVRVALPRFSFLDPVRVCEPCSITTRKENEFFDKHLPLLQKEAQLEVESTTFPEQTTRRMFCLLSQFHDVLKFSGDAQIYLREVAITRITKLQMLATPAENGANVVSGVTFIYKDDENSEQTVTLKPFGGNKRPTLAWIMAFKNGMKLIFEAKSAAWDSQ